MYFTGEAAQSMEQTVRSRLKTYLQDAIDAAPYAAIFATYGGVDVILSDDEPVEAESAGRPYIDLRKAGLKIERWGKRIDGVYHPGNRYLWTFEAVCIANSFSGAQIGVTNPVASDTLLCDALVRLIEEGYDALAMLGLEEADIEAGAEEAHSDTRLNLFTLRFTTHAVPSLP